MKQGKSVRVKANEETGGIVYSWGSGEMGQLGFSSLQVEALPKDNEGFPFQPEPVQISSLNKIAQIAGGDGHSLAVTSNGQVLAWGASACGQLGLKSIDQMPKDSEGYPYHPQPKIVKALRGFKIVLVACGDAHSAALSNEGSVFTWGGGGCGQLGHPDTSLLPKDDDGCPFQPEPRAVEGLNAFVKHISCGKAHTVAVSDKLLYTWGAGACGQLGHPDTSDFPIDEDGYPYHPTPKPVISLQYVKLVMSASGDVHTLVLSEDGAVYCFGGGSFGQLGLGNMESLPVDVDECPFMPVPTQITALKKIKISKIACGDSHSMALSENGDLYGWGAAACGQLGMEHFMHRPRDFENWAYEPLPSLIVELKGKKVVRVACGEAHTLALTESGILYSFGASNCGQLGIPKEEMLERTKQRTVRFPGDNVQKSVNYQPLPRLVTPLLSKKVLDIACGGMHNLAITETSHNSLVTDLYRMYKQGHFTDMSFRLKSEPREELIHCHRVVIASRSPYLRQLTKTPGTIDIDFQKSDFRKIIKYLYFDDIDVLKPLVSSNSFNKAVKFLQFAHTYQLSKLQQACQANLLKLLNPYTMAPSMSEVPTGLVYFPDGRAAILSPDLYERVLSESILLDAKSSLKSKLMKPLIHNSVQPILSSLDNSEFSDVTLLVERQQIYCHRVVLAARSDYFSALYSHGFREAKEGVIEIGDLSHESMLSLLRYFYSDTLPIDMDKLIELLTLCERFSVPSLKSRCEEALAPSICVENAALLYKYAKAYQCLRLKEICLVFIEDNFSQVICTQAFEDLDKESILEIMRFNKKTK